MKFSLYTLLLSTIGLALLLLSSCSSGSSGGLGKKLYDPGYGPFDAKGNYLESEADKKAKQKRRPSFWGGSSDDKKAVVKNTKPTATTPPKVVQAKPVAKAKPVSTSTYKPKPTVVKSTPKPKPKPTVVKSTPKPKPKPKPKPAPKYAYHKIAKGDTLYSISKKYGTSVSTIQKNNGLSGTTIYPGSTLKIPK